MWSVGGLVSLGGLGLLFGLSAQQPRALGGRGVAEAEANQPRLRRIGCPLVGLPFATPGVSSADLWS